MNDSERRGREDEKRGQKEKFCVFTLKKKILPKRKMPPVPPLLSVIQISFLKYMFLLIQRGRERWRKIKTSMTGENH